MKYYVLLVVGDVEPELKGPFANEAERDKRARELKAEHGDDNGIFRIQTDANGEPVVSAYRGGFFLEEVE